MFYCKLSLFASCHNLVWGPEEMQVKTLIIWGIVVAIVSVVDYIVPMYFTKVTGGSKYAERGAIIGLFAGIILWKIFVFAF